jgi:hypothetical protein
MIAIPTTCPFCGGEMFVARLHCNDCDTTIEGRFSGGHFSQLTPDQFKFLETFIRCEGKFTRMETELGLSYPTLRNRLQEVIHTLGYETSAGEEPVGLGDQARQKILEDLDSGAITADEAMHLLQER